MSAKLIDQNGIFQKVKDEAETNYKSLIEVNCPYLNKKVKFNTKGLDHIKLKDWNKARPIRDQLYRLKFLKWAPLIIERSHTLQEFNEKKNLERQKINSRWEIRAVQVNYYGFVAILKNIKIKVVVKHILGGEPFFWSIIPFWKTRVDPITGEIKKVLHDGDLESE